MRRMSCLAQFCAYSALAFAAPAMAQSVETELDEVTVYATRSPQSTFSVPAIVEIIDAEAPGNALSSDMSDLFEFTPGVEVENGPRRNGQTVSIRGFDDEAIVTLVDGRRQNYEAAHDGRFFLDPTLLKSVEVVKGASSSIYGGGAIGGVLAFETKDAADLLRPGETRGVSVTAGYRSGNREKTTGVTGYARTDTLDMLGNVSYKDSGDIALGDGDELNTEDLIWAGMLKVGATVADFHNIDVQYQFHRNDGLEPNNPAGSVTTSNPIVEKNVKDRQYSLKYGYEDPANNWLNPSAQIYFNDTEVEEVDITGSNAGREQNRLMETLGFNLDNQQNIELGGAGDHIVSYGFEIYKDEQIGTSSTSTDGTRAGVPDADATNYGLYVQDEIVLGTAAGELRFIPAIRYDDYSSSDVNGNSQDESQFSPKFGISYLPIESVMVFGSVAQAFRAPNLTEIYASGQHFPGNNFIANPDLKPETVTTYEVGGGVNFHGLAAAGDRLEFKGSGFYSKGEDFIDQEIGNTTTESVNIDEALIRGFDGETAYSIGGIRVSLGVSYVHAIDEADDSYLSNNVPLTFVSDLSYTLPSADTIIGWRSRVAKENTRSDSNTTKTEGYGVHDIYLRWQPAFAEGNNLIVDVGVDNVFDKTYSKRFATLRDEGRSYGARVSLQW